MPQSGVQGKVCAPGEDGARGQSFTLKFLFKQQGELQLLPVWSSSGPSSSRCQYDTGKRAMTGCGNEGRPSYIIQRGRRTRYTTEGKKNRASLGSWALTLLSANTSPVGQIRPWHLARPVGTHHRHGDGPGGSTRGHGHPPPTWRRPWRQHPGSWAPTTDMETAQEAAPGVVGTHHRHGDGPGGSTWGRGHPPPTWRPPWRQHLGSARHVIHSASFDRLKPTYTHQFSFLSPLCFYHHIHAIQYKSRRATPAHQGFSLQKRSIERQSYQTSEFVKLPYLTQNLNGILFLSFLPY